MKECHLVTNQCGRYERSISETWFLILKKIGYGLYVYSPLFILFTIIIIILLSVIISSKFILHDLTNTCYMSIFTDKTLCLENII